MHRTLFFSAVLLLLFTAFTPAQVRITKAGAGLGLGSISGNSPSSFAYTASLSMDIHLAFWDDVDFRFGAFYARDFDILIPEDRFGRYYPYVQGLSLEAVTLQPLGGRLFIEGTAGVLALNDRTFGDTDLWAYGALFSATLGVMLYDFTISGPGFTIGFGIEYGATFTDTTPKYLSNHIEVQYLF